MEEKMAYKNLSGNMSGKMNIHNLAGRGSQSYPYSAVDIIIEYNSLDSLGNIKKDTENSIVLIKRKNFPYGLALPGGFAECGLSLEDNCVKESKEETGLDVVVKNPEHPLCIYSRPDRDPRAHIITHVYVAKGSGVLKAGDDAKKAGLYSLEEVAGLLMNKKQAFAFPDHARALLEYLWAVGYKRDVYL
jgi:ADP-ribose pyrophosphatase YjhB (NUDIX family)